MVHSMRRNETFGFRNASDWPVGAQNGIKPWRCLCSDEREQGQPDMSRFMDNRPSVP